MKSTKPLVTRAAVALHDVEHDLWIIVGEKVYDVTLWQHTHPGGPLVFQVIAGKDATDLFRAYHDEVSLILDSFVLLVKVVPLFPTRLQFLLVF